MPRGCRRLGRAPARPQRAGGTRRRPATATRAPARPGRGRAATSRVVLRQLHGAPQLGGVEEPLTGENRRCCRRTRSSATASGVPCGVELVQQGLHGTQLLLEVARGLGRPSQPLPEGPNGGDAAPPSCPSSSSARLSSLHLDRRGADLVGQVGGSQRPRRRHPRRVRPGGGARRSGESRGVARASAWSAWSACPRGPPAPAGGPAPARARGPRRKPRGGAPAPAGRGCPPGPRPGGGGGTSSRHRRRLRAGAASTQSRSAERRSVTPARSAMRSRLGPAQPCRGPPAPVPGRGPEGPAGARPGAPPRSGHPGGPAPRTVSVASRRHGRAAG